MLLCLLAIPVSADAQQNPSAEWLDSEPIDIEPASESVQTLVNLSTEELDLRIDIVGEAGELDVVVSPETVLLPVFGTAQVTVTASASSAVGSVTLVAWGRNTFAAKQVTVAEGDLAPDASLPDSLGLQAHVNPLIEDEAQTSVALPEAVVVPTKSSCGAADSGIVGRISGPDGRLAAVCTNGTSLNIEGVTQPGTWSGKVDLLPDNADAGSISISIAARDSWMLPAYVLVVGLMLAYLFPLGGVWRSQLLFDHETERALVRVRAEYAATRDAIIRLENDSAVDLDRFSDEHLPLYLDRVVDSLRTSLAVAVDAATRAPFAPPDGPTYKSLFGDVIPAVISHYQQLRKSAEDGAMLRGQISKVFPFPDVPVGRAFLLNQVLELRGASIDTAIEWQQVRDEAVARAKILGRFGGLWSRIGTVVATDKEKKKLTIDLIQAADDAALDDVAKDLRALEGKDFVAEQDAEDEGVPAPPIPGPGHDRKEWIAWAAVGLVILIIVTIWSSTQTRNAVAPEGTSKEDLYWPALAGAAIILAFALRFVSKRLLPRSTSSTGKRIRRLDLWMGIAGGIIVVSTGFVTLYLQKATFGGPADYFTIATWGFSLGSGVSVAKRLLTQRAVEVM